MLDFLNQLDPLLKSFWYVALISSAIFIIQTLLTFIGGADMDGVSADFDGDLSSTDAPFQFFSFRNLINFMLGFGWSGVVFYKSFSSTTLLVMVACLVGLLLVFLFIVLMKQIIKLSEDNTFKISDTLHLLGTVYIPIPEALSGKGKIQISVKGSLHELEAMTEDSEKLLSGTPVIVEKISNNILIVKKINQ